MKIMQGDEYDIYTGKRQADIQMQQKAHCCSDGKCTDHQLKEVKIK